MHLTVNGDRRELPDGARLGPLVDQLAGDRRGIAVAIDGEVVPRTRWDEHALRDGARVELVGASQGG